MTDINKRLKYLEFTFGVDKKEPNTLEEFLEQYPDYEELDRYFSDTFHNAINEKRVECGDYFKALREAEKALEEDHKYLNDSKLQRANKCLKYYHRLHPAGIKEMEELQKELEKIK